jgi:hypothetical protein
MKTIKQILSEADKVDLADNIDLLAEVGLFEEKRLNLIKRALNKNPNNMTMAEAKALKEFTDVLTEEILCEKQDHLSKYDKRFSGKHTEQELPTVIILKRKAIRVYPDNQKVALYYSQSLDRYISIPYGPKGEPLGMTMNESVDTKVSPEDGNKIPSGNAKSPSAREMQKDVDTSDILKNMKQNEPENPRLKFAPGMKLKEESPNRFKRNLQQIRENKLNEGDNWQDRTKAFGYGVARGATFGLSDTAAKALGGDPEKYEKENPTASSAGEWGSLAIPGAAGLSVAKGAVKGVQAAKMVAKGLGKKAGAGALAKGALKGAGRSKAGRLMKLVGKGIKAAAKAIGDVDLSGVKKQTDQTVYGFTRRGEVQAGASNLGRVYGGGQQATNDPTVVAQQVAAYNTQQPATYSSPTAKRNMWESNLSLIKKLSKSKSLSESVIHFSDENSVTINKGTAKKVMKIYNSLNEDNKKKIERMLSEDITSFKQAINFIVRH